MKLPRHDWAEVLRLLDHALELPAHARSAWLAALPAAQARLQPVLARLLEQRLAIETDDFLGRAAALPAAAAGEGYAAGTTIGPYRLLRPLGEGGMAVVWLAERADAAHQRPLALKLPLLAGRPRVFAERFERERRILSALAHPHIAAVLDAGVDGAQPWLALEYVDGQPITAHAMQHRLDVAARLRLFVAVLRALEYAHAQLVIHRDLKPSNVLVDGQGTAKLLDFGVAKLLQPDGRSEETALTQLGGRALTPQYASPEQVAGRPLGTASDIYSAGVLLYELLTGRLPYRLERSSAAALEVAILSAHVVAPSKAVTERATARALAGDIDAIVQKALAHEPAARYGSAAAFADDIENHLARRPIAARAPARWYVASRFVRRHRFGFAAGAALVLALAAGLTATTWQMQRAEREAVRAGAIKDFLVSVFSASDPSRASERRAGEITARELLDASVERIEREFAADPPTMVELLGITSEIYAHLQEAERYESLMARRLELARREYGARHPIVVRALLIDAWASIWHKDRAGALAQLAEIDKLIGATRGARSLEAAEWWLARRSALEADPGAGQEHLRSLERALALFEALDPRNPNRAVALANAGAEHWLREEFVQARERYARAADAFASGRQGHTGDLVLIELKLGQLNFELGDPAAAERWFASAYQRTQRTGDPTSAWSLVAGYAGFLHRRGERERAHAMFAAALEKLPPTPSPTGHEAALQRAWGDALLAEGRAAEALPVLQAAWQAAQQRPGTDQDMRRAALLLARAYAALGQEADARALFRHALDHFARHAPGSMAEASARVHWAGFLARQGDAAAAQAEYRAVLVAAGARLFEAVPRARLGLATLAAARGDLDAAWRLAEQARADAERLTVGHDVRLHAEIWRTLAQLAQQRGDAATRRRPRSGPSVHWPPAGARMAPSRRRCARHAGCLRRPALCAEAGARPPLCGGDGGFGLGAACSSLRACCPADGAAVRRGFQEQPMQTRASRLSIVTALAFCALWFTSPPGLAQGVLKPVEALIVNPPSRPVPVNVIAPPAAELAPLVTCNVTLARFTGGAPFAQGITSQRVLGDIACPAGVSHLDVQRVIYDPSPGSENVAHYHLLVGTVLPTLPPSDVAGDFQPLAMLTEGAPDVVLPRPRRIDLTDTQRRLRLRYGCGSGVAGIAPACSGVVYLIGTAVR